MEGILKFDLKDENDLIQWARCHRADTMTYTLCEIQRELDRIVKYEDLSFEEHNVMVKFRDRFYQILNENNLDLEELNK